MTDRRQGYYHCQSCGHYYWSEIKGKGCPQCGATHLNIQAWDEVIKRRNMSAVFETHVNQKSQRVQDKVDHTSSAKLDIIGRKKAQQKAFVLAGIIVCFMALIGLVYKSYVKSNNEKSAVEVQGDGSLSAEDYANREKIAILCYNKAEQFFASEDYYDKVTLLYRGKIEDVIRFQEENAYAHNLHLSELLSHHVDNTFTEIVAKSKNGEIVELVFVKQGEEWLLDWDFLITKSDMNFAEFLEKKPEGVFNFRLLFTEKPLNLYHLVTFHEYRRNSALMTSLTGVSDSVLIKEENKLKEMKELIEVAKTYQRENEMLSEKDSGALAMNDPKNYYRINVSLEFDQELKILKLVKINAAHWLGGFYVDKYKPSQQHFLKQLVIGE